MINVIGAGIAGSITARLLRKHGHQVRVFDDGDMLSGSRASSNLYIASWLKKFGSSSAALGIEVLESLFPQEQIDQPFSKGIADAAKVRHISQRHLHVVPDVVGTVDRVVRSGHGTGVVLRDSVISHEGQVVLCCGHRANHFWPGAHENLDVLVGHAALFEGRLQPGKSKLTMPLPYKHHKLYQFDEDTIYFANSTALKLKSYQARAPELQDQLIQQGRDAIGVDASIGACGPYQGRLKEIRVGYRPCTPGHDFGELRKLEPGVWSMNGGGKNGLVAYAALAHRLLAELGPP